MADSNTEELTAESWWTVVRGSPKRGATPLVERCMRLLGWKVGFTLRALDGYRDFLRFKHGFEDWNAQKLSPSLPVDKIWHMHILDTRCYENDCKLLLGQFVHHDADGDVNTEARKKRIDNTKGALKILYPDGYDEEVWNFGDRLGQSEAAERERNMVDQRRANRASQPDSPISQAESITIRIHDQTGEVTFFEIKQMTPLGDLFEAYSKLRGEDASSLRFLLGGEKVEPYDTPFSIQLEDDDKIEVLIEQTGC